MKFYSTGEAAKAVGVTRDSLFGALKNGAPDAASRMGGRRFFTEDEVAKLAEWYGRRQRIRDGQARPGDMEDAHDSVL